MSKKSLKEITLRLDCKKSKLEAKRRLRLKNFVFYIQGISWVFQLHKLFGSTPRMPPQSSMFVVKMVTHYKQAHSDDLDLL